MMKALKHWPLHDTAVSRGHTWPSVLRYATAFALPQTPWNCVQNHRGGAPAFPDWLSPTHCLKERAQLGLIILAHGVLLLTDEIRESTTYALGLCKLASVVYEEREDSCGGKALPSPGRRTPTAHKRIGDRVSIAVNSCTIDPVPENCNLVHICCIVPEITPLKLPRPDNKISPSQCLHLQKGAGEASYPMNSKKFNPDALVIYDVSPH